MNLQDIRLASRPGFPRPQALRALEKVIRRAIRPDQRIAWSLPAGFGRLILESSASLSRCVGASDSAQRSECKRAKLDAGCQWAGIAHAPRLGTGAKLRTSMKTAKLLLSVLALLTVGTMVGCWGTSSKSPDVSDTIRKSLDQAGLKDVTVSQDRDKGIVTLGGEVSNAGEKAQAESLAKSFAGAQVVADQIAIIPAGQGKEVSAVNSDLDQGIEKNLDAALIQNKMHHDVKYAVKNGVVTLTGQVSTDDVRKGAEQAASGVPNVQQVVNDIQVVKNRKASSSQ